ncbi:PEP-CTERM sorting domain-containing protein [Massilia dura]|uniref:PEP-CTERM sorting domain-containing protein n=1 Tax=Pseudoduganella dura TaxID=321982 RepID=A0A6I3XJG9_9BURK|nr:MHFG family PEP-CTERM protein [Pseudoduganella dura]MUI16599.1 PEP-CTERM sorting domain-containing protein [Pseudoduganella dura]GGY02749.1 hypothetical protein GCM10007386_37080 [Pseudoduganella dura]
MSTLLASAAVATAMLSHCSWNQPGRNPYRGSVTEAVSRYVDIPAPVRTQLIARIESGRADDTVAIMRDSIAGKYDYSPRITGMHFGQRTVCETVTRNGWSAAAREPATVYCVGEQCLIVPKICGNISRVQRVAGGGSGAGGPKAGAATPPQVDAIPVAEPAFTRVASPDDVAAADAMAQTVASEPQPALLPLAGFQSPFGAVTYGMGGHTPGPGTEHTQLSPVPEPATLGMIGAGLALLAGMARRRARGRRAAQQ